MKLQVLAAPTLAASLAIAQSTGFEELPAGGFEELRTPEFRLLARPGHAAIDDAHARAGTHGLRLLGGDERSVILEFAAPVPLFELAFWAERWTRREPFALRIEARRAGRWEHVHDADDEVRVGGFHVQVRAHPAAGAVIDALRLTCTSPEGSGLLVDDLELRRAGPMRLRGVTVHAADVPLLVGNARDPLLGIELETEGNVDPLRLEEVVVDLEGTDELGDVEGLSLVRVAGDEPPPPDGELDASMRFGRRRRVQPGSLGFRAEGGLELEPGRNVLWLCATLAKDADIDRRVDAGVRSVRIDGQEVEISNARPAGRARLGVRVRGAGDDGARVYRIPGLVTTKAGTLLGVYDVRYDGWRDLPANIDVGLSRSTDGGRTWEPMRIIADMGDAEAFRGDGIGDPAVLVDRVSGDVWVTAVWSHGDRGWHGSGPGLTPEETGQLMLLRSRDDGRSWSTPRSLTPMLKDPEWSFLLQGPGRGIATSDGLLVFPAQFQLAPEEGRVPHSTVIWSADHGQTWEIGAGVRPATTESAVVELQDGVWMLNMRDDRGGSRSVFTTRDRGASWTEHGSSRSLLPEPVCMASLIHVGREGSGEADGRLVFSNPRVDRAPRRAMTLQGSHDFGASWPEAQRVLLDAGRSAGYSCLTLVDDETLGILYEGSRAQLTFQRLPLADLFDKTLSKTREGAGVPGDAAPPR